MAFQLHHKHIIIGMLVWIFPPYKKSPNWMNLISINFHFLCIGEYKSMLVQAGSFWIPFSLLETVVRSFLLWTGKFKITCNIEILHIPAPFFSDFVCHVCKIKEREFSKLSFSHSLPYFYTIPWLESFISLMILIGSHRKKKFELFFSENFFLAMYNFPHF